MKKRKRFVSILLAAIFALLCTTPAFAANAEKPTLQFKQDGTFRIMQMTDTHCTDQLYPEVIAFLEKALDEYKPDLVVFTGDIVTSGWFLSTPLSVKSAIDQVMEPIVKRNIPFTGVFGNHDWQTGCPKKWQLGFYQNYDCCLMEEGFCYHHRIGTHNVTIQSSDGTKDAFNLWMMDSGSRNINDDQNPVKEEQVQWYKDTCAALTKKNGGVVPALAFQHVPVEEVNKLFLPAQKGEEGAVKCSSFGDGVYYKLNTAVATGVLQGAVGIGNYNSGEYAAWVEMGDVLGAFFGHNHVNDYCGTTPEGITLGETRATGFQSRGDGGKRGVRIFDLDEKDLSAFKTFMVYYSDYFEGPYPESKKEYDWKLRLSMEWTYIMNFITGK